MTGKTWKPSSCFDWLWNPEKKRKESFSSCHKFSHPLFITRQRYFSKFCFRINQQNYKNNSNNINLESENSSNEEDILSVNCRTLNATSTRDNIDDLVYRNPSLINPNQTSSTTTTSQVPTEQHKKSHHLNDLNVHNKKLSKINTCKGLQRKLEQKVERAKKNFLQNEKLNQLENDIIVSFDQGLFLQRMLVDTAKSSATIKTKIYQIIVKLLVESFLENVPLRAMW